jgi:hypothetical protein
VSGSSLRAGIVLQGLRAPQTATMRPRCRWPAGPSHGVKQPSRVGCSAMLDAGLVPRTT